MSSVLRMSFARVRGEKQRKLIVDYPDKTDARALVQHMSKEFIRSLESRGYDARTLRFEIHKHTGDAPYVPLADSDL